MGTKFWLLSQTIKTHECWIYHRVMGDPLKGFLSSIHAPHSSGDRHRGVSNVLSGFGRGKVARTEPYGGAESLVMVDYDKRGRVLEH